jgi:uncharacterized protein YwqG
MVREGKSLRGESGQPNLDEVQKWKLLFEVGSHYDPGMLWWDAGCLDFFIHADDLKTLDFSKTYAAIQSS